MPIQPKTSDILPKICQKLAIALRVAEDAHLVFEARLLERHAAVLDLEADRLGGGNGRVRLLSGGGSAAEGGADDAPPVLREVVGACWRQDPDQRPSFEQVVELGFGLGFATTLDEVSSGTMGAGDYYWGGAAGTKFWVSTPDKAFGLFMVQRTGYETPAEKVFQRLSRRALEN